MLVVERKARSRTVVHVVFRLNDPLKCCELLNIKLAKREFEMILCGNDPAELTTIVPLVLKCTSIVEGHWIERLSANERTTKFPLVIKIKIKINSPWAIVSRTSFVP